MDLPTVAKSAAAFSSFLLLLPFLLSALPIFSQTAPVMLPNDDTDRLSFLAFKNSLTSDSLPALRSWNTSLHFCRWLGVTCSTSASFPKTVTALNLTNLNLRGPLSPHLSNLSSLTHLDLSNNFLRDPLLPHLLPQHLLFLNLSANSSAQLPTNLSLFSHLTILDLHQNQLQGPLPPQLGSLPNLTTLALESNLLSGPIPPSLGNLSSLSRLALRRNTLQGNIPHE